MFEFILLFKFITKKVISRVDEGGPKRFHQTTTISHSNDNEPN